MKVAVVGAGAMGSASAYALGRRGHTVDLFDQFPLGHDRGSSHGRSRIIRRAYPDRFYTEIMVDAYPMWADLEVACGQGLVHECGLLYFGDEDSPIFPGMIEGLRGNGVPFEVRARDSLSEIQPSFRFKANEIGVFTPQAGWVAADRAIAAMQFLSGATYHQAVANPLEIKADYDAVVVAAGGWIREFLPSLEVRTTLQTFAYLDAAIDGPVWIEDGEFDLYGFPSEPTAPTMKYGYHLTDVEIEMDAPREPSNAHLEALSEFASRRMGIAEPQFKEIATCVYTATPNEDFRWGGLESGVFWVSPCSGHGFKFAPWIGERMADFCEGRPVSAALHERFSS